MSLVLQGQLLRGAQALDRDGGLRRDRAKAQNIGIPVRLGAVALKLPVIALVDGEERDRLIAARDMGIRNWVAKETLTPSRLAAEVKSALEAYGIWEEV